MLKGRGNAENIVCPLHRWTYDLKGALLGAPHFDEQPCVLFFFQAEDGIRDGHVTGVQTCALPICYADPAGTVEGFRRRASELGARILQWTPVRRILRRESRVTGVETSAGRLDAGAVVVAAGAWAPRLCREIGLELPARVKGLDTVQVERPRALSEPHVIFIDNVLGTYFRPESGIRTIVGVPCQEWDLDPDAPMVLAPGAAAIGAQILTHRIPAMEGATLARGYRAVDCYSRDRHAILGRVDGIDGLYLATAFSGAGFKISPAVGVCMAELILDGRAKTVDIAAFGLKRFAEWKSPEGPYPYAPRRDHTDR